MPAWLISLLSVEILLLADPSSSFHFEPAEGSLAGGTWITVVFDGLDRSILYPNNGSQLEIDLVNVAIPALRIPCDVSPVFVDLPVVTCQTRSLTSEAQAGLYSLEIRSGEQVLDSLCPGSLDSCTFKFSKEQTPLLYQVNPASGVPGEVVQVYGRIIADRLETFDPDVDYMEGPLILEAGEDKWFTPCSLINQQTGNCFPIQEEHGLGTVQCRVEGDYIGSQNVSFSVFNKGRSMVHKEAWRISAKQELFRTRHTQKFYLCFQTLGALGEEQMSPLQGISLTLLPRLPLQASHVILDMCLPGRSSAPPGLQETEQGSPLLRQAIEDSFLKLEMLLRIWS